MNLFAILFILLFGVPICMGFWKAVTDNDPPVTTSSPKKTKGTTFVSTRPADPLPAKHQPEATKWSTHQLGSFSLSLPTVPKDQTAGAPRPSSKEIVAFKHYKLKHSACSVNITCATGEPGTFTEEALKVTATSLASITKGPALRTSSTHFNFRGDPALRTAVRGSGSDYYSDMYHVLHDQVLVSIIVLGPEASAQKLGEKIIRTLSFQ